MGFITIIIIAVSLSGDSFAVSVTNGFSKKDLKFKDNIIIAISFAVFQTVMPVVGWLIGSSFAEYIKAADHWIAFGLLSMIGVKMIYESKNANQTSDVFSLKYSVILLQAFATSIDALIIGISFSLIEINILYAALTIGFVTFIFSLTGFCIGKKFGNKVSGHVEIIGGIILILLGIKILIEHLFFGV
jgi:manganese efflux pump family protein